MQDSKLKEKVLKLRAKGYSYSLITKELGVSKSTLSNWLKDVPFDPNGKVLSRIKSGPLKSGKLKHNKKVRNVLKIKKQSAKEVGKISKRDLWMLGLGLYLGDGSKVYENIRIINSDPEIIKLARQWFVEICGVKYENLRATVHIYPDIDESECLKFWSDIINISEKQFRKTQIDKRKNKVYKKKSKLPYGTVHLSLIGNGNPDFGNKMHRKIIGWLEACLKQMK